MCFECGGLEYLSEGKAVLVLTRKCERGMRVGIIGGSGYFGGELLRILLYHPEVEVKAVISRRFVGEYVYRIQPNLRGKTQLRFAPLDIRSLANNCDLVFTAVPHGTALDLVPALLKAGLKVIDTSADYRLKNFEDYDRWYGWKHTHPKLLKEAVYGLPEIHRKELKKTTLIACPGCMSTAVILGLAPLIETELVEKDRIIADLKIGSSGAGSKPTPASHHPERFGGVRPYEMVHHRHVAEIEQELNLLSNTPVLISFTPHAVNIVRGILATIHLFLKTPLKIPDVWKLYRTFYTNEPFIRLVRDNKGLYQRPNPSILVGSNFCDVGFDLDPRTRRMVIFSAVDNLMKGASGQAVQCLNILLGIDETTGLVAPGFHPR
jgi:N-acetyl-gamma-glutamyl-phosphate/LysW-gamma-L-alpha-aminoadipyl-6-phosphate reductase